jgi:ATP-binding cassette subfamily B protein
MSVAPPRELLRGFEPFDLLPARLGELLDPLLEPRRFRLGQTVLDPEVLPDGVMLIRSGQLRSLAAAPRGKGLRTIERLGPGSVAGWVGLVRQQPCEHLRATTEVEALLLPAQPFLELLEGHPSLIAVFQHRLVAAELHALLLSLAPTNPWAQEQLEQWPTPINDATVRSLVPGPETSMGLSAEHRWFVSSGGAFAAPWPSDEPREIEPLAAGSPWLRLIGLPLPAPSAEANGKDPEQPEIPLSTTEVLQADEYTTSPEAMRPGLHEGTLILERAVGAKPTAMALCTALAHFFGVPVNRDNLGSQIDAILERQPRISLINLGQLMDGLGLRVVLSRVPTTQLNRIPVPAALTQNGRIGLIEGFESDGLVRLLEAELGALQVPAEQLVTHDGSITELLLFERKQDAKTTNFGWEWFKPYLKEHRRELIEYVITSLVISILRLALPLGLLTLIRVARPAGVIGPVYSISAIILLAIILEAILKSLRSYIFTDAANRIDQSAKTTVLDHLIRLPQQFFDSRPVGRVVFYFNELDRLRDLLLGNTLPAIIDTLFVPIYLAVILFISPILAALNLLLIPLVLAIGVISNPVIKAQIVKAKKEAISTYSYLTESIAGVQTIKAQNAELKTRWGFQDRYSKFLGEDFKLRVLQESSSNILDFTNQFSQLIMMVVALILLIQGTIGFAELFAVRILGGYVFGPITKIPKLWQQVQLGAQSLSIVADVVDRPTEQSFEGSQNIPMPPLRGHVKFMDVSFRYRDKGPLNLDSIDLEIPTGSFVGLVGGSGSGKSTLLKLLPRSYSPLEGKILVDGLDISKVELYSLRRQIGVVPQESTLFDGTVRDNLLMVKPDASSQELINAARIACAHDFIMELPQGYSSSVGERGAGLSGGQRQRLALARAILLNPRMLILDEATSALDASTERQVCINLFEALRGRTVFFITHRLSTVRPADIIVLMDQGAVVETGNHNQLMDKQGWYYALYSSQNQEEIK